MAADKIGVEKDFHASNGFFHDPEAMLSRKEGEYANAIRAWRSGPLDLAQAKLADELIGHLRLRARVLREIGRIVMQGLLDKGEAAYDSALQAIAPSDSISDDLVNAVRELPAAGFAEAPHAAVDTRLQPIIQQHVAYWLLRDVAAVVKGLLRAGLPRELLAGVHTHLIVMQVINQSRGRTLPGVEWAVRKSATPLLLGDFGPVCVDGAKKTLTSFNAEAMESSVAVLLPLSPHRLLVGSRDKRFRPPSTTRINEAIVELSFDFVIGRQSRSWFEQRLPRLGVRSDHCTPEQALGVSLPDCDAPVREATDRVNAFLAARISHHWRESALHTRRRVLPPSSECAGGLRPH